MRRLTLLALLVGVLAFGQQGYQRSDWPHWSGSCPNVRHRVLAEESLVPVTWSANGCTVVAGRWYGYYTGQTVTDPRVLDIDHMVPLHNAYDSGGWAWDRDRRRAYANDLTDPEHLVAVSSSANRQKGDRSPDEWRPSNRGGWCRYAASWALVKLRWGLSTTEDELVALQEMRATCPKG